MVTFSSWVQLCLPFIDWCPLMSLIQKNLWNFPNEFASQNVAPQVHGCCTTSSGIQLIDESGRFSCPFQRGRLVKHRNSFRYPFCQWLFVVPLMGGRWYIIPQLAVYTTYIPIVLAFWGVILYVPPNKGTRNNHWFCEQGYVTGCSPFLHLGKFTAGTQSHGGGWNMIFRIANGWFLASSR